MASITGFRVCPLPAKVCLSEQRPTLHLSLPFTAGASNLRVTESSALPPSAQDVIDSPSIAPIGISRPSPIPVAPPRPLRRKAHARKLSFIFRHGLPLARHPICCKHSPSRTIFAHSYPFFWCVSHSSQLYAQSYETHPHSFPFSALIHACLFTVSFGSYSDIHYIGHYAHY